jgi:hypothetical protein
MTELMVGEELARRWQQQATAEKRSVEALLRSMLDIHTTLPMLPEQERAAFAAMEGMFDDEVNDLSTSVRQTMSDFYKKKYGNSR